MDKTLIGSDTIVFNRTADTMCTIHLFGCTVTSWRVKNIERLFVSRKVTFDRSIIRGGAALIFPRYGTWAFGPHHGFARKCRWEILEEPKKLVNADVEAVFVLRDDDYTRAMWCFQFEMRYRITLHEYSLELNMEIINTSKNLPFDFEIAWDTYIKARDVTSSKINRFVDCIFRNQIEECKYLARKKTTNNLVEEQDENAGVCHLVRHAAGGDDVNVCKTNLPDTIIWNPWDDLDVNSVFDENEYNILLNISPAHVLRRIELRPGERWWAQVEYGIIQPVKHTHLGDCSTVYTKTEKIYI